MKIYTTEFNSRLGQMVQVETEMEVTWRSSVSSISELPTSGNINGDLRMCLDTDHLYVYINGVFIDQGVIDVGNLLQERLMQGLS
jgi:hypothetical protein